jgi:hypothetical protein
MNPKEWTRRKKHFSRILNTNPNHGHESGRIKIPDFVSFPNNGHEFSRFFS